MILYPFILTFAFCILHFAFISLVAEYYNIYLLRSSLFTMSESRSLT